MPLAIIHRHDLLGARAHQVDRYEPGGKSDD
jgi:hypothetical protein